jgi:hypothetical protein
MELLLRIRMESFGYYVGSFVSRVHLCHFAFSLISTVGVDTFHGRSDEGALYIAGVMG